MNARPMRAAVRLAWSACAAALLLACSQTSPPPAAAPAAGESAVAHARLHRDPRYVCPMHPQIVRDGPGTCPICGMALVPRSADAAAPSDAPGVEVSGALRQALGVRTGPVERRALEPRVRAPARVALDEDRIAHVHTRVAGWVEGLHVHAVGERVNAGAVLLEIYAPDLVVAQEDYVAALKLGDAGSQRGAAARLRQFGVDEGFIAELGKRGHSLPRVPIRAPRAGVVTALNVRHGMYVEPALIAVEIADTRDVWVMAEVFPEQLDRLGEGAVYGAFRLPGVDRVWRAPLDRVYPEADPDTRTLRLRFKVPNRAGLLRIGSYLEASLRGEAPEPVLAVPDEAVIRTADGERVLLAEGEGRFRPVPVHVGRRAGGYSEIRHGLDAGQSVVLSAQFLLDSDSALRAGLQRLQGAGDAADDASSDDGAHGADRRSDTPEADHAH